MSATLETPPRSEGTTGTTAVRDVRSNLRVLLGNGAEPGWSSAEVLHWDFDVDPDVARRLLPRALRLPDNGRASATMFFADYRRTAFGIPYREVGVLLHASSRGRPVMHCTWMVVDDDSAMIMGREMLGFPKKLADIGIDRGEHGTITGATVTRHGFEVVSVSATPNGAPRRGGDLRVPFDRPIVNVWGGLDPLPKVLIRMDARQTVHSATEVELEVAFGEGERDPLHELGAREPRDARFVVADIGVPPDARPSGTIRKFLSIAADGTRPVGLVSPKWLWERYVYRTI